MDVILHNIQQSQLPLIQELAKALGISFEKKESAGFFPAPVFESEEAFSEEMNQRFSELESGTVKGYSWEEVKAAARK